MYFFLSLIYFFFLFSPNALAVRSIDSVIATPDLVVVGIPTSVKVLADIAPDIDLISSSVALIKVGPDNKPIGVIGYLFDDGSHGDEVPNDHIFTILITINQTTITNINFRVSVAYKKTLQRTLSDIISITVSETPFSTPPDPAKIINQDGKVFPVNEVVINLPDGSPRSVAEDIATSINGEIAGFAPSANLYQIILPVTTLEELTNIINILRTDSRITNVFRNYFSQPFVTNDLTHLKTVNSSYVQAYEKISLINAYDFLINLNPEFHPVKIGIIDSGVDVTHPEFSLVDFGNSPSDALTDSTGHGTSVAGIIGSNNLSALSTLLPTSLHMNGIVSGIPLSTSTVGSLIPYSLAIRKSGTAIADAVAIDQLAIEGAQVINMSFGFILETAPSLLQKALLDLNLASSEEFLEMQDAFHEQIFKHKNITFVAAAGNWDFDVVNVIPANILAPNLITVGATDLSDNRASWFPLLEKSNFGDRVDIAAPGTDVYAPSLFSFPLDAPDYTLFDGTSAAAPVVTGSIALLLAINPTLKPAQIENILKITGDSISTDKPISGKRLNILKAAKFVAKPVDVFLLVDMTGSFSDDLAVFKAGAASMINDLVLNGLNVHLGLGRFEDYPINPWGSSGCGDRAYQLVRDIRPATEDANNNTTLDIIEAIQSLFTLCGNDGPEAQLPALFQAATGAGQDVPPTGLSLADIPSGQQVNFRSKSLPIFVLWTDASFHRPGDSFGNVGGINIPYPGPSFTQTINALNTKGIKVIGIAALPGSGNVLSDLSTIVSGTNTLAPSGGVDCDDNGTIDVAEGQPLICRISSTGAGISKAIAAAVLSIAE